MHSKGNGSTLALSQDSVEAGVKELYGVAAAASVPRFAQGRRLSREALLDALFWCIAQKEDDEAAASGQQLDVLREGFAERGEAWLRAELEKHNVGELHGVAASASI
ncbi:unnamed protein product, partial [Symbiodinium sp. KB8]